MARATSPPKPAQHLILLLLAEEPTYGVELLRRLDEHSEGTIRLNAGSLYRLIAQLVDERLLKASDAGGPTSVPGAPRKVYEVTEAGRLVLRREALRQQGLLEMARRLDLLGRP